MFSAVLFDLDGTLLDIDIDSFLHSYFGLLGPVLSGLSGGGVKRALDGVMAGTDAMAADHVGVTNQAVFTHRFAELTGIDLNGDPAAGVVERFYAELFPSLSATHGPKTGVRQVLSTARSAGLKTVLATNPIFPRAAIDERARWAGVDTGGFDLVTSYENMHACKPSLAYFRQIAVDIGVEPERCLMVGDDPLMDMPAADTGMSTYYVGTGAAASTWCGDLLGLADLIARGSWQRA